MGTWDELFDYQVILQRCWDMNRTAYICFIDYEKAFDRVQHDKLIKILNSLGPDYKDLAVIENLHWH